MAVVLGKQSALRVWDGVVADRNRGARVDWNAPVNRGMSPNQRIYVTPNMPTASQDASIASGSASAACAASPNWSIHVPPNTPAVSQGASIASRSVPFAFQSSRDFRHALERDTKAAVKLLMSGATPALDLSIRDRFFSDGVPVHAIVAHARLRRARGGIETSVRKGPFHPRSFMRIDDGLYVRRKWRFAKWRARFPLKSS